MRDTGLIACAQAVEHHEMARYGALVASAKMCGVDEAVPLLEKTLEEETRTDRLLNKFANDQVNKEAAKTPKAA